MKVPIMNNANPAGFKLKRAGVTEELETQILNIMMGSNKIHEEEKITGWLDTDHWNRNLSNDSLIAKY